MYFRISFLLVVLSASVLPVAAQTSRDSTVALGEIVVVDSMALDNGGSAVRVTRIDVAGRADLVGSTVADLLESESFLFIRRNGAGGLATASLRGAGAAHTQVLFDGMRMADPQTGQVDLTTLPSAFVESVTIGHGAAYVASGKSALGGTVELLPVRPGIDRALRLKASAGAWGERQIGIVVSLPLGPLRSLVAYDQADLDGAFPLSFSDVANAPDRREGADRSARNVYLRAEGATGSSNWFAAAWFGRTDRGVPGPANAPPVSARQSDRIRRYWAGMDRSVRGGRLNATVGLVDSRLRYVEPGPAGSTQMQTRSLELRVEGTRVFSSAIWMSYSGAGNVDQTDLASGYDEWSGKSDVGVSISGGRLTVQPNIGVQTFVASRSRHTALLPSISVALFPIGSDGLVLRASFGKTLRPPTFNDRYWIPGGNPNLAAEKGWSADTGFRIAHRFVRGSLSLDANVFWSRLTDRVVWHPSLAGSTVQVWRPGNVGRVQGSGLEVSTSLRVGVLDRVSASTSVFYTHSRMEDRTDPLTRSFGRQLRYVPEDVLKARLSLDVGHLGVDAILNLTGRRFVTSDESQALHPISDAAVRIRSRMSVPGGRLHLSAALENALDNSLETIRFFPMPPRHIRVSLAFESGPKF